MKTNDVAAELDAAAPIEVPAAPAATPASSNEAIPQAGGPGRRARAAELVELVPDGALFHDQRDVGFARIDGKVMKLQSSRFKAWLAAAYYDKTSNAAGTEARNSAVAILMAKAARGRRIEVHVRVAPRDGGGVYLDLADGAGRVVEVTADGWRILDASPVMFWIPEGLLALPEPKGGRLDVLRHHVNLANDDDWALLAGWLVGALMYPGPFPALCLYGQQGSAKSTTARMVRELVDPTVSGLRAEPKEVRDLAVAASRSWIVGFDNLSHVQPWLSDALCRLATGGGFATRTLYTDDDESIFTATRPLLLTSIDEVVVRGDLLDRALVVTLPAIPEGRRRTERELWAAFRRDQPEIVGGLLDAAVQAFRNRSTIELPTLPRMADFAQAAVAAEVAMGVQPGTFMRAYQRNHEDASASVVEADPVALALTEFAPQVGKWVGTATELLRELEMLPGDGYQNTRAWPRTGLAVSKALRRTVPQLRERGIDVTFLKREGNTGRRLLSIEVIAGAPTSPSAAQAATTESGDGDDGDVAAPTSPQLVLPARSEGPIRTDEQVVEALRERGPVLLYELSDALGRPQLEMERKLKALAARGRVTQTVGADGRTRWVASAAASSDPNAECVQLVRKELERHPSKTAAGLIAAAGLNLPLADVQRALAAGESAGWAEATKLDARTTIWNPVMPGRSTAS